MIKAFAVSNYRSLRDVVAPLAETPHPDVWVGKTRILGQGLLDARPWNWMD